LILEERGRIKIPKPFVEGWGTFFTFEVHGVWVMWAGASVVSMFHNALAFQLKVLGLKPSRFSGAVNRS
jgi:hypothetical protein